MEYGIEAQSFSHHKHKLQTVFLDVLKWSWEEAAKIAGGITVVLATVFGLSKKARDFFATKPKEKAPDMIEVISGLSQNVGQLIAETRHLRDKNEATLKGIENERQARSMENQRIYTELARLEQRIENYRDEVVILRELYET